MRTVIFHYHLFKNAGTSLDAIFKENFSEEHNEWLTKEFSNENQENRKQVRQWILDNPQAKCFSSHTAMLPPPIIEDVKIFVVIFIRHPLDRISSAYAFEKNQIGEGFGAVLARNTDLKGYIETRLSLIHDRQCRNFHTFRFAQMLETEQSELEKSLETAEKLPFVGVVEYFDQSIEKLKALLKNDFNSIELKSIQKNVSQNSKLTIEDKLISLKNNLGDETFYKLLKCNEDDLFLYNEVVKNFN